MARRSVRLDSASNSGRRPGIGIGRTASNTCRGLEGRRFSYGGASHPDFSSERKRGRFLVLSIVTFNIASFSFLFPASRVDGTSASWRPYAELAQSIQASSSFPVSELRQCEASQDRPSDDPSVATRSSQVS